MQLFLKYKLSLFKQKYWKLNKNENFLLYFLGGTNNKEKNGFRRNIDGRLSASRKQRSC